MKRKLAAAVITLLLVLATLYTPGATAQADPGTSTTSAYCDDVQQLCSDIGWAHTMSCLLYENRDCFAKGMKITFDCMRAHGCSAPRMP